MKTRKKSLKFEKIYLDQCSICFEPEVDIILYTCGHTIHQKCLKNLLKTRITCPNCRTTIRKIEKRDFKKYPESTKKKKKKLRLKKKN